MMRGPTTASGDALKKGLGEAATGAGRTRSRWREEPSRHDRSVRFARMVHGRVYIDAVGPDGESYDVVFKDGDRRCAHSLIAKCLLVNGRG